MNLYGEPRVWLEQFPLGEPSSFSHDHLGVRYPGEVIRCDRWSPELGEPLAGEVFFRIVLMVKRRGGLRPVITDRRIALCLPAVGYSRRRGRLSGELATTRETQALYLTHHDAEADLIRQTLQRHQTGVEEQLMGEESVRYSEGQVLTGGERQPETAFVFAGLDLVAWFMRLAGWLLAEVCPTLPLDSAALPRPVTGNDASELYRAIFRQPEARPDILEQLGPGLGLSTVAEPAELDLAACRVLELVRDRLSGQAAGAQWADIHHYLAHEVGLTGPLATLYLLVYLYCGRPELAVSLAQDHQLSLADGRPLRGNRITPDLVPALRWHDGLSDWAQAIGPATEPSWNDALQHLSALSPGLTPIGEGDSFEAQERSLLASMESLTQELRRARELLGLLGRAQELLDQKRRAGTGDVEPKGMAQSLGRLSLVLHPARDDFRSVFSAVRSSYPDYRQLEADLAALHQMAELGRSTEEILRAQEYLEGAAIPADRFPDLSIDREALRAALAPASLVESRGRNWSVLVQDISRFKSRYATAYGLNHEDVHNRLPSYRRDLESAQRKLAALDLLNTLPELGDAVGAGLAKPLAELDQGPPSCSVPAGELQLEGVPWCNSCRLSLDRSVPWAQLARLLTTIDIHLGRKNGRLSKVLVERLLLGQEDVRLEGFLKIVQASDLSALSNTLTPELLTFVRQMLA
jgi:hypothetical protein